MLDVRTRYARARDDDGFSLTELAVAGGIFSIAIVLLAGVLAGGMRGMMTSRQRSAATADMTQVLETARAMPFENLGLASDDATLDTDPAIVTVNPTTRTFNGEPIVFAVDTTAHPFKPHVQTHERPPSTLTRAVYVTGVDNDGDGLPELRRVTTTVTWARSQGGVSNQVTGSTLFAPGSPGTPGNIPVGDSPAWPPGDDDFDNDGTPNDFDGDDDNDGIPDPTDPDDDNDGIPDVSDPDDDNDGVDDEEDPDHDDCVTNCEDPGCPAPCDPCPAPCETTGALPLDGDAFTNTGRVVAEVEAGLGSDLDSTAGPPTSRATLWGINGNGSNRLAVSSAVECAQQFFRVGGKAPGFERSSSGASVSTSADSERPSPSPNPSTVNQTENPAGNVPPPIGVSGDPVSSLLLSQVSCDASAVDAGTSMPYERGTGTSSGAKLTVDTSGQPLLAGSLGTITLGEVRGLVANQSVEQQVPSDRRMAASATHGVSQLTVVRAGPGAPVPDLGIGASQGLVYVSGYQATATSTADRAGGTPAVSFTPYTIGYWNNGVQADCPPQGAQVGLYCTISVNVNSGQVSVPNVERDVCVGSIAGVCVSRARVSIKITLDRFTTETIQKAATRQYRAEYVPARVAARLSLYNTGAPNLYDVQVTADLGRILTCAWYHKDKGARC